MFVRADASVIAGARCTVCDSPSVRLLPFHYEWRDRRWFVVGCRDCTHEFIYPAVGEEEQREIYRDEYFSRQGDWVEHYWSESYLEAESKLREEAREVLDMLPIRGGRLLEIGSAGGFLLDEARRRGFDPVGIEINDSMAAHARERLGATVVSSRIEDIPPDRFDDDFDVIVMMDVLEHIPQPRGLFEKASRWLRQDGCVLIRGPLANSRAARLKVAARRALWIEKRLEGYPLDANSFTKRSLARLLEQFGIGELSWIGETREFANLLGHRRRDSAVRT